MRSLANLLGVGGRAPEGKTIDASALSWSSLLVGAQSKAGVPVTVDTALRVTTVLACCRVLAEGIAQIPLKLLREHDDGSKELAKEHPLYKVLWRKPNDWQTSFEFRESMMLHALLDQGGFAYINRVGNGKVKELLPILPGNISITQGKNWDLSITVSDQAGVIAQIPRKDLLIVRGPSWNGVTGMQMVAQAREAIGLAIATEESLERLHSNGVRPSGILSAPGELKKPQLDRLKESFMAGYAGLQNAFKTIVLDGGMTFSQMGLSPHDAQSETTRIRQVEEIARVFRVFPQLIGYADKTATYASAEQFFTAHVVHSLGPWIERWEQALTRDLLTDNEVDAGFYPKFAVAGLLRGDAASRSTYYKNGIVDGWLTRNEARRLEDFDPLDGLDEPLQPMNMITPAQAQESHDAKIGGDTKPTDGADGAADDAQPGDADIGDAGAKFEAALAALRADLDGGLEAKAGRVISAKNETKLAQARDLVNEVLAEVDQENAT